MNLDGRPKVIVTSWADDNDLEPLADRANLIRGASANEVMTREQVLDLVPDADAIINLAELRIDGELLGAAKKLRIVANAAAGYNNMDLGAMKTHGVWGSNCPHSFSGPTADHALALLLALSKRLFEADSYVRSMRWRGEGWQPGGRWDGMGLEGKQIGIIGYGRIGRKVGDRARAFGMTVKHLARRSSEDPDAMALPDLLTTSDVISLHCPLTPETHHLMNRQTLARMKPGALLLNLARGPVVENEALLEALDAGHLGGAGLDVFEFEPEVPEALFAMSNVILTPHMAGCTREGRRSAWLNCARNVAQVLDGKPPVSPVTGPDD